MAGCFIGSFILPRAADIVGRRPMFLLGLAIFMSVVVASLFCKNIYLAYFLLFMGGISETGRYYVAYVYLIEFMPSKYQNNAGLYIFMCFGFVMTFIALQFWFVVKYWQINAVWALSLALISFVLTITWLPESPRYYYGRKKFRQASVVMSKILYMNKGEQSEFQFEAENESSLNTKTNNLDDQDDLITSESDVR